MFENIKSWFKDHTLERIENLESEISCLQDKVEKLQEENDSLYESEYSLRNKLVKIEFRNNILISICILTNVAAIAVAFLK